MVRRQGRLLEGLWEPPGVELNRGAPAFRILSAELRRLGLAVHLVATGQVVRHRITDSEITAELWRGKLAATPRRSATLRVIDPHAPSVAVTALARRVAGWLASGPAQGLMP
jgi:hypothetical protein